METDDYSHYISKSRGMPLSSRYQDNLNLGAHAENEIGRPHTGRRVEEEEGSGKERVMEGRTGLQEAGGLAGERRDEVRVSQRQ